MRKLIAALAAGFVLIGGIAEAKSPETLDQLDQLLAARFKEDKVPGATVAIIENGQVVMTKNYGVADLETKAPVTDDTVFRAGSISKSFTGIAVMTLVEQGKLDLNGKVAELAPEVKFTNAWEQTHPLRLAHLIEHTTGWPDRLTARSSAGSFSVTRSAPMRLNSTSRPGSRRGLSRSQSPTVSSGVASGPSFTPTGLWTPERNSTWAPSSWRVRSPIQGRCAEQAYQSPVVLSMRVSASS